MLIDTHAHLVHEQFNADRSQVLQRAKGAAVVTLIEIGEGPVVWDAAISLTEAETNVFCSLGLHPYHTQEVDEAQWDKLENLLRNSKVKAVGEIGLDYFKNTVPKDVQFAAFLRAISLAKKAELPLVIHCRDAYSDMGKILADYFAPEAKESGVLHCFQGSWEDAQVFLNLGFYLGFDGPLTYPKSHVLKDVFLKTPIDRILFETDAPYLPPQPFRGKRNEPAYVRLVAEEAAKLRGIGFQELAKITTENAQRLFRLP